MDKSEDINGKDLFGREGAGVLILARDTGRILAVKRSDNVQQSRTWGIPGGKIEGGEKPEQAAAREVSEEVGYKGKDFDLLPLTQFKTVDGHFRFNNFLAIVDEEFTPTLDHETEAFKWVNGLDDWPDNPHFGIQFLGEDQHSLEAIRAEQACCDANMEQNRQQKTYPPTLYHLIHNGMRGDTINPSQANDLDPQPYVYASSNIREVLPYLTPNGTRIVNCQIPGSEDWLTILPDRDNFLAHGKMSGTIYQFSGDGFEKHPRHDTQWVSKTGVKVSDEEIFDKVENMETAMHYGLHVLFTKKPFTPENYEFIDSITNAPDFPHNIPKLIADGTLVYENAERGIKPSAFLTDANTLKPEQRQAVQPKKPHA
ncbi:MAG: NUDIX hydrolase [Alphaproteobacteria bacterium]|nr:NUDIX hydrolase [Alphaproteobacteria bacterium]